MYNGFFLLVREQLTFLKHGIVWYGMVGHGMARHDMALWGMVGLSRYAMVRYSMVRLGMVWSSIVWYGQDREHSGSVVECLTRERRAAGSSLIGVTGLWSLSKTHLS